MDLPRRIPLTTLAAAAVCALAACAAPPVTGSSGVAGQSALSAIGVVRAGTGTTSTQRPRVLDDRPNVLMITADDAVPRDLRYMPRTEKLLAARGATFTDAVAPDPICVPARASLLTGQYAHNHGAYTISGDGGGFSSFDSTRTLPVWLQAAGYDTLFIGKYLNGYGDAGTDQLHVEPGWTQWRPTVGGSTYNFTHPVLNMDGRRLVRYHEYNSTLFLRQTQELLSLPARQHQPWYMWVNYVAPHVGGPIESDDPQSLYPDQPEDWVKTTHPAPRDKGSFASVHLPRLPNMFHTSPDQPSDGVSRTATQKAMFRTAFEQRLEAVQSVDRAVAATVRTLIRTHQLANTYVIFSSDNGFLIGQHDRYGKLYHFNDSERIPLIIAGPGVPHGIHVRTSVANPDLATTIAAIAHARPTRPQDGVDILPFLGQRYRDRIIPIEAYPVSGGTAPIYTGIREGSWTYVHFRNWHGLSFEEMYDRATDRFEMHNLAGDPMYRRQLRRFRRLDRRYRDCAGDTCPKVIGAPVPAPSPVTGAATAGPAGVTATDPRGDFQPVAGGQGPRSASIDIQSMRWARSRKVLQARVVVRRLRPAALNQYAVFRAVVPATGRLLLIQASTVTAAAHVATGSWAHQLYCPNATARTSRGPDRTGVIVATVPLRCLGNLRRLERLRVQTVARDFYMGKYYSFDTARTKQALRLR